VLSDPIKKAFIDRYGSQQLKEGFFDQGAIRGGHHYNEKAETTFD
jgi:DnaJ homolog subfamily B member 13